jgi:hypothetical protein
VKLTNKTQVACGENHQSPPPFSLEGIADRAGPDGCEEIALIDAPNLEAANTSQRSSMALLEPNKPSVRWLNPSGIKPRVTVNTKSGLQVPVEPNFTTNELPLSALQNTQTYSVKLRWTDAQSNPCEKIAYFRLAKPNETADKDSFERTLNDLPPRFAQRC